LQQNPIRQGSDSALAAEFRPIDAEATQGERVVALASCSFKNKKTGKIRNTPKADIHRFRDGEICELFEFYDTIK
jgi:ketosteroid isomerase-like protein